jgi:hypothetical protein
MSELIPEVPDFTATIDLSEHSLILRQSSLHILSLLFEDNHLEPNRSNEGKPKSERASENWESLSTERLDPETSRGLGETRYKVKEPTEQSQVETGRSRGRIRKSEPHALEVTEGVEWKLKRPRARTLRVKVETSMKVSLGSERWPKK